MQQFRMNMMAKPQKHNYPSETPIRRFWPPDTCDVVLHGKHCVVIKAMLQAMLKTMLKTMVKATLKAML